MNRIILLAGENATVQYASSLIGKLNCFFQYRQKRIPYFNLSFENTKKVDLLGILLIYKFLEYSVTENCFMNPGVYLPDFIKKKMKFYGFHDLVSDLMSGNDTRKEFERLKIDVKKDFFIAPIALLKGVEYSSEILNQKYFPQISNYYNDESKSLMIFQMFTELYSNFISHAEDETKSIMVAHGDNTSIEIACADTGIGIVPSLKHIFPKQSDSDILIRAISKGVTSKPKSNHMGYGLWYIDEVVKRTGGRLDIITGNTYYKRLGNKTWISTASKWQGTVIYLNVPLEKPVLISDLEKLNPYKYVNFI